MDGVFDDGSEPLFEPVLVAGAVGDERVPGRGVGPVDGSGAAGVPVESGQVCGLSAGFGGDDDGGGGSGGADVETAAAVVDRSEPWSVEP